MMRTFYALLALLPLSALSQVLHEVEAGGSTAPGSTTDPYYDPMDLTINVDDAVHWMAVSGSHNVYGELDEFPANPEGFSSGQPTQDLDYTFIFTIPGVYMYHCTQQGHSATQHGTITVMDNTNVEEKTGLGTLSLYPIPATGQLTVELDGGNLRQADILAIDGRVLRSQSLNAGQRNVIDVSALAHGRYLIRLMDQTGNNIVRTFVKE